MRFDIVKAIDIIEKELVGYLNPYEDTVEILVAKVKGSHGIYYQIRLRIVTSTTSHNSQFCIPITEYNSDEFLSLNHVKFRKALYNLESLLTSKGL